MLFLLVKKLIPAARLASSDPPFSHVRVDYFGPLPVQQGRMLTCMPCHPSSSHRYWSHVGVRFIPLRLSNSSADPDGPTKEIFSDNGTNFTGSERRLREAVERLNQDQVNDCLRQDEVQWHFNPPEASHQGGVWERMIRSVRKILGLLLRSS